jgi:hypothetical protein
LTPVAIRRALHRDPPRQEKPNPMPLTLLLVDDDPAVRRFIDDVAD